ncbi:MAG TPA: hypothetical protein VF296_00515 [Gallionella sp.]
MKNETLMQLAPKSPAKIAGVLSLLSTMFVLAIWFKLLFVGMPSNLTVTDAVIDQLSYFYSDENPSRLTFVWLAMLPLITAAIGSSYLLNLARSKKIAFFLLALTIAIGLVVLAFGPFSLAIFVLLPAYWGWRCLEDIQMNIRIDG